mmetsp:Transcript_17769/g.23258  ORF Transcript_17769/g.23258 Transcript_17769/m.23258 type:complete len:312 (+) Transcript_17769:92-1027(+)
MLLRVCSFNVRRFRDPATKGVCTAEKISLTLARLNPVPAIVCLNEVDIRNSPDALERIAGVLGRQFMSGRPYRIDFFGHVKNRFGNAILSRPDIRVLGKHEAHLPGGTQITIPSGEKRLSGEISSGPQKYRIIRGMLEVIIEVPLKNRDNETIFQQFSVLCTHLDHMKESERSTQLAHITATAGTGEDGGLLLGDFNALKRSDYSDPEWQRIVDKHSRNSWSAPESGCLKQLEECATNSWVDVFEAHHGDLSALNPENKFTAHVAEPMYRIDYCFANDRFLQKFDIHAAYLLKSCKHSDHFPVMVDFRPKL